ncbi:MAG TPA: PadR family transcriptional regulator [Vicinamibacterales bacterium]|jgi:DNA-binding PadR family transcriptional regulator|nr:PadR family transcriptional regulator [Vicinamibacterales bacterium]
MSPYDISCLDMARSPDRPTPLSAPVFHVLVALADDELHGYALLKAVEAQTDGRVRLSTGTLYGIINRLLADGAIADRTAKDGKRVYRLTPAGRELARAEADRLEALVAAARATRALGRRSPA